MCRPCMREKGRNPFFFRRGFCSEWKETKRRKDFTRVRGALAQGGTWLTPSFSLFLPFPFLFLSSLSLLLAGSTVALSRSLPLSCCMSSNTLSSSSPPVFLLPLLLLRPRGLSTSSAPFLFFFFSLSLASTSSVLLIRGRSLLLLPQQKEAPNAVDIPSSFPPSFFWPSSSSLRAPYACVPSGKQRMFHHSSSTFSRLLLLLSSDKRRRRRVQQWRPLPEAS